MGNTIYADNAATTRLDEEAFEVMKKYMLYEYGNVSQKYSFSRESKKVMQKARFMIAECIGAESDEIYFTSGGTESDNWAIKNIAYQNRFDCRIVTSQIEHHAILNTCRTLEKLGTNVCYLPVDRSGIVSLTDLEQNISENTKLVSIMYANNEIGTIEPIGELTKIAHKKGILFHTDAVQVVGHIPINVKALGVDFMSASAHKFNGPKGIGFLYVKKGMPIASFIDGGAQENGLRAGTENVPAIIGMAVALKNNCDELKFYRDKMSSLEQMLISNLRRNNLDFIRNGSDNCIPGNISLSFKGFEGEMLLHRMDLMGISISTGSACDSKNTQLSHVLKAINIPDEYRLGTIRISFGKDNTEDDAYEIAKALIKIICT